MTTSRSRDRRRNSNFWLNQVLRFDSDTNASSNAEKNFNHVFCVNRYPMRWNYISLSFDKLISWLSVMIFNTFPLLKFFTWFFQRRPSWRNILFFSIPYCLVRIYFKVSFSEETVDICISTRLLLKPIFHNLSVFKLFNVSAEILVVFVYGLSYTSVVESAFFPRWKHNVYHGFYSHLFLP